MRSIVNIALVAVILAVTTPCSQADMVAVPLTRLIGTVSDGTAIFRANLDGIDLTDIQSIIITDSNSQTGGSSGAFSGFDLDAIKLSTTLATSASAASSTPGIDVFDFSPAGTVFTPGTQRPPVDTKLSGTDASGTAVDEAFATLDLFDAIFFGAGSVTLGDGGEIGFNLTMPVSTSGLLLYLGEVSGDTGENVATLFVSSRPLPEPGSGLILLTVAAATVSRIAGRQRA